MKQGIKNVSKTGIVGPIAFSIMTLGPIGWFLIDYYSQRYDRLVLLFVASLLLVVVSCLLWVIHICCSHNTAQEDPHQDIVVDELNAEKKGEQL